MYQLNHNQNFMLSLCNPARYHGPSRIAKCHSHHSHTRARQRVPLLKTQCNLTKSSHSSLVKSITCKLLFEGRPQTLRLFQQLFSLPLEENLRQSCSGQSRAGWERPPGSTQEIHNTWHLFCCSGVTIVAWTAILPRTNFPGFHLTPSIFPAFWINTFSYWAASWSETDTFTIEV